MLTYSKVFEEGAAHMRDLIAKIIRDWPGCTPPLELIEDPAKVLAYTKLHLAGYLGQKIEEALVDGSGHIFKAVALEASMEWPEVNEKRYYEMLNIVPPATMTGYGFLVGEPWDHDRATGHPRFAAFICFRGDDDMLRFFNGTRPIGIKDFRNLDMTSIGRKLMKGEN